jgi:sugar-specific transcriptional regulator TrmB
MGLSGGQNTVMETDSTGQSHWHSGLRRITLSTKLSVEAFTALGLTPVEAEVYVYLIQNSPATGYAIANAIDRTKGAIYKVLGSLEIRGAILVEDTEKRLCRAIPPEEFISSLETDFNKETKKALDATRGMDASPADNGIYRMSTPEQVYERSRTMLRNAKVAVLMDIFPEPLKLLKKDIEEAARRGVKVALITYEKVEIPEVWVSVEQDYSEAIKTLPLHYFNLSQDGCQFLMASISTDGEKVVDAFWSANLLYVWSLSNYLKSSILSVGYESLVTKGSPSSSLKRYRNKWYRFLPNFISPAIERIIDLGNKRPGCD